jgi:hypothetical protein
MSTERDMVGAVRCGSLNGGGLEVRGGFELAAGGDVWGIDDVGGGLGTGGVAAERQSPGRKHLTQMGVNVRCACAEGGLRAP